MISPRSLFILILWDVVLIKKHKIFGLIQGPVVVVICGILLNQLFREGVLPFSLSQDQPGHFGKIIYMIRSLFDLGRFGAVCSQG